MIPYAILAAALAATPAAATDKPAHLAVAVSGYDSLFLQTNFSNVEGSLRAASYRVEEIDARNMTENELLANIRGVTNLRGPLDLLYFGVHGHPHVMNLSARERITPEDRVIDEFDVDFFKELKKYLAADASIILESCYTGHGIMNVATMMAYVTQRTVYAPNRALFLVDKDLNPTSTFEFDAETGKPTAIHMYGLVTDSSPHLTAQQRFYPEGIVIGPKNFEQYKAETTSTFNPANMDDPMHGPDFAQLVKDWLRYTKSTDTTYEVRLY